MLKRSQYGQSVTRNQALRERNLLGITDGLSIEKHVGVVLMATPICADAFISRDWPYTLKNSSFPVGNSAYQKPPFVRFPLNQHNTGRGGFVILGNYSQPPARMAEGIEKSPPPHQPPIA